MFTEADLAPIIDRCGCSEHFIPVIGFFLCAEEIPLQMPRNIFTFAKRYPFAGIDALAENAFDVFHHDVIAVVIGVAIIDGHNVPVVQCRNGCGFPV